MITALYSAFIAIQTWRTVILQSRNHCDGPTAAGLRLCSDSPPQAPGETHKGAQTCFSWLSKLHQNSTFTIFSSISSSTCSMGPSPIPSWLSPCLSSSPQTSLFLSLSLSLFPPTSFSPNFPFILSSQPTLLSKWASPLPPSLPYTSVCCALRCLSSLTTHARASPHGIAGEI